jgi:hypothetical protein
MYILIIISLSSGRGSVIGARKKCVMVAERWNDMMCFGEKVAIGHLI